MVSEPRPPHFLLLLSILWENSSGLLWKVSIILLWKDQPWSFLSILQTFAQVTKLIWRINMENWVMIGLHLQITLKNISLITRIQTVWLDFKSFKKKEFNRRKVKRWCGSMLKMRQHLLQPLLKNLKWSKWIIQRSSQWWQVIKKKDKSDQFIRAQDIL